MYEWDETHCWRRIRILAIREAAEGGGMQATPGQGRRGRPTCFYLNGRWEWTAHEVHKYFTEFWSDR